MASLALPRLALPAIPSLRLRWPKQVVARHLGVAAAAILLVAAVAALAMTLHGSRSPHDGVRVSLSSAVAHAPTGWRERLTARRGPAIVSRDVIRLSGRALTAPPAAGRAAAPTPPPLAPGAPLPVAPIAGFSAPGPLGPLPIIAQDGRTPFQVYRRPFAANGRPMVALVVGGLGLNSSITRQAIETLPAEITLAFTPYAEGLQGWIDMARAHGHEVLISAPMEPVDYPDNDPGPNTLMAAAPPSEVLRTLEWVLSRATGYFGVTNAQGSRFLASDGPYRTLIAALRGRGLAFFDDGSAARRVGGPGVRGSADRTIDDQLSAAAIDQELVALEAGALQRGQALGSAAAYPVTLNKVAQWSLGLAQRGFQLAPASALAHQ